MNMRFFRLAVSLSAVALGSALHATEPVQMQNFNAVWFESWIGLTHGSMRVASPDGKITDVFQERGTPVFNLSGNPVVDGVYRYELRARTNEKVKNRDYNKDSAVEGADEEFIAKQLYTTGRFVVERGVITKPIKLVEDIAGE